MNNHEIGRVFAKHVCEVQAAVYLSVKNERVNKKSTLPERLCRVREIVYSWAYTQADRCCRGSPKRLEMESGKPLSSNKHNDVDSL